MNIKEIRETSGMSRAEFSRVYGIPLRTLENWEAGTRKCPDYLLNLIKRSAAEDSNVNISCYDKDMLKELGILYNELVKVTGGNNPYPYADVFPTKYFTMLHNSVVRIGIPDALSERIAVFIDHIDPEDWAKSMDIPVPMSKRQYFLLASFSEKGE